MRCSYQSRRRAEKKNGDIAAAAPLSLTVVVPFDAGSEQTPVSLELSA
jgi:hypothetical protein